MKQCCVAGVLSTLTLALCGCPTQPLIVGQIYPNLAVDGVFVVQGVSIDEYDNGDLFVLGKGIVLDRAQVPIGIRLRRTGEIEWATLVPLPPWVDLDDWTTENLNMLLRFRLPDFPADLAPDQEVVLASRIPFDQVRTTIRHVRLSPEGDILVDDAQVVQGPANVLATLATQDSGSVILGASDNGSFLLRLDRSRSQIWFTNLEEVAPRAVAVAQDAAGDLFVIGQAFSSALISVGKLSASGEAIWSNEVGGVGTGVPNPQSIAAAPDGGAVFAGPPFGSATAVTRVDADGKLLWVNTDAIGSRLNANDYHTMDIAVDSEGNTIVVGLGTTKGQILMFQIFTDVAFIAKFDPDGNVLWLRTLPTDKYLMNAVTVLQDGTYATTGLADVNGTALNVILFDPETGDVIN
jgi:hypothetical protein